MAAAEISDKQKRFCEEYVIDFNGTQAAIRAGYSQKTANEQAAQLLAKLSIQNYLSELKKKAAEDFGVSKQDLVNELKKISFFDIRRIFTVDGGLKNVHDFDDDSAAAIAGIESYDERLEDVVLGTVRKVKVLNKISAIERLSKMLGYDAPERKDITGNMAINWHEEKNYAPEHKTD